MPLSSNIRTMERREREMNATMDEQGTFAAKLRHRLTGIVILTAFGLIQGPLLVNLQLCWKAPQMFPVFAFDSILFDVLFTFIAGIFLLIKANQVKSLEWWSGFLAMAIPYIFLKSLWVYWDQTQYLIAAAEGRHIGGGAAMGHVFLIFYLMGPAAIFSIVGFYSVRKFRRGAQTQRSS